MDKISMWMSRYQFAGYDLYHLVAGFFLFSIIGWMVESVYMSLCNRKLTNRGFMSECILSDLWRRRDAGVHTAASLCR